MRQFGGYEEMAPDKQGSLKIGEEWNFPLNMIPQVKKIFNNEEFPNTLSSIEY